MEPVAIVIIGISILVVYLVTTGFFKKKKR
jgi:hypothetical protein